MTAGTPFDAGGVASVESERVLLSAAMSAARANLLPAILGRLSGSDFSLEPHQSLWDIVRALSEAGKPHDGAAVLDYARTKSIFVGGAEYVAGLVDDVLALAAGEAALKSAADRVKDFSILRHLGRSLARGQALCHSGAEPAESVIAKLDDDLQTLKRARINGRKGPRNINAIIVEVIDQIQRQMAGEARPAVPTGFGDLDRILSGLVDQDFVVLGARPSMGKTSLMLEIAVNRARLGRPQLIFETETKDDGLVRRALASAAQVNANAIRNPTATNLSHDDFSRISEAMEALSKLNIEIDDTPGPTLAEIRSKSREFVARHGPGCDIWTDYLQNVHNPDTRVDERVHVSRVSKGLKLLARELDSTVIALSQLSRLLESRANKRPMMSDLRESGQIEQDADVILFVYRDEYYNTDTKEPGVAEVIVAKQREGAVGIAKLGWNAPTTRFYPLS